MVGYIIAFGIGVVVGIFGLFVGIFFFACGRIAKREDAEIEAQKS